MVIKFNRSQRRKLAKRLSNKGVSVDEAISLFERKMSYNSSTPIEEGKKVKLNYDRIKSYFAYEKKNPKYKQFVEDHKDDEFTVMYDEKHKSGKLVSLVEDETEPRWYWWAGDLIEVKEEEGDVNEQEE